MNILQIESNRTWGGQEYGMLLESIELMRRNHKVFIVTDDNHKLWLEARKSHIPVYKIPMRKRKHIMYSFYALYKIIKNNSIEIIHCHNMVEHRLCYPFYKYRKIPIIRWRHVTYPTLPKWWATFLYRYGCSHVAVRCRAIKDEIIKTHKVPPDKIIVITGGIDFNVFHPSIDGTRIRKEYCIPEKVPIVGIIGRLGMEKGHRYFIEAAKYLVNEIKPIYFLIVGASDSTTVKELKHLAQTFKIDKFIIFTGYKENISEIMAATNVLVIASSNEGIPRVLIEGLAMQKPIVATDVGGITEVIKNGITGIIVPPRNSKRIAEGVKYFLTHPSEAERIAHDGYTYVRRGNFSIQSTVDKIEKLHTMVLSKYVH